MKSAVLFKIKDLWKVYSCKKSLQLSEEAPTFVRQPATCFFPFIHSVWISFFAIISFTLATSILRCQSLTRIDEFRVSTRHAFSVLQRTSGSLGSLDVSCSMAAINIPVSLASLSARVSEADGLFVTWSSYFDDQHIGAILFIVSQTKIHLSS